MEALLPIRVEEKPFHETLEPKGSPLSHVRIAFYQDQQLVQEFRAKDQDILKMYRQAHRWLFVREDWSFENDRVLVSSTHAHIADAVADDLGREYPSANISTKVTP